MFPGSTSGDLSLFVMTKAAGLHLGHFNSAKIQVIPGQHKRGKSSQLHHQKLLWGSASLLPPSVHKTASLTPLPGQ